MAPFPSSSFPRNRLHPPTTQLSQNFMLLLLLVKSSNGFVFGWLTWEFHLRILLQQEKTNTIEATRIIGHAGKLTRNIRHITIQMMELQSMIKLHLMALRHVGSAVNKANHCTKLLAAAAAFLLHTALLMGIRFITAHHAAVLLAHRNQGK
jgi:hypothetical protein